MYYLGLTARLLLILVFVVTAAGKSWRRESFDAFVSSLTALRLFPRRLSTPVAVATIAAEAVTAVLLAVPATASAGLALSIVLLAVFAAGILAARRGGRQVPCRCFGGTGAPLGVPHVIRNALLATVAATGLAATALASSPATPHPGGAATGAVTAAVGTLLVVRMDDLLALASARPTTAGPSGGPTRPAVRPHR
ncbi:MauE/DoxX family redox-associated membrane protein [Streptomyces uncialis]|uniref:MauE/DoxX family redox-associated membrane protein n=1 Tax=Streptomyces uncialis TaxID=1048205 RepID=UPI003815F0AB